MTKMEQFKLLYIVLHIGLVIRLVEFANYIFFTSVL